MIAEAIMDAHGRVWWAVLDGQNLAPIYARRIQADLAAGLTGGVFSGMEWLEIDGTTMIRKVRMTN